MLVGLQPSQLDYSRFALMFLPTRGMNGHDRNPVQEKHHEHEYNRHREDPGDKRSPGEAEAHGHQEGQARDERGAGKQQATKPKADRTNKKAEVIAMMKRAKGATLAEIMAATGWQAHTVRGFVSLLGSKGGEKIESTRSDAGERSYKTAK